MQYSIGLSSVLKRDFLRMFNTAYKRGFIELNIASGWRKTGLQPFNPSIVLDKVKGKPTVTTVELVLELPS